MSKVDEYRNGLVCLVPRTGSDSVITSHEKTLCDCQVLEIFAALDEARRDKAETLKRLRARVVGYSASRNVFRVIDDEIQKADPSYKPNYSARARSKVVIERNELVEKLRVDLDTANALLDKAFEAFDDWLIAAKEECSHHPEWKAARAVVEEIANLMEGE